MRYEAEVAELRTLSARLGRDPLLVQASSGNTSIKLHGALWIKASGKWLAHAADEEILVPVSLTAVRENLCSGEPLLKSGAWVNGHYLSASIETAMHAILPHRVVVHVHSVNALSWAVRLDGPERLAERFEGLHWAWIPYVLSGLPLARAIEKAVYADPAVNVFVLANHGLVVCGDSCDAAGELVQTVERRLSVTARAIPVRSPSEWPRVEADSTWTLPQSRDLHALGADPLSRRVLEGGVLCPCQAIFLGSSVEGSPDSATGAASGNHDPVFKIVGDRGVVTNRNISASQRAVLDGLLQLVRRIDAAAPVRYLSRTELRTLLNEDAHLYQMSAERNAVPRRQWAGFLREFGRRFESLVFDRRSG